MPPFHQEGPVAVARADVQAIEAFEGLRDEVERKEPVERE
jgi:hypothetical protein